MHVLSPQRIASLVIAAAVLAVVVAYALIGRGRDVETRAGDCFTEKSPLFAPLPSPGANDWLASHRESGQTFEQWQREPHNVPGDRNIIYLQPLDEVGAQPQFLEKLRAFTSAYFGLEARLLPPLKLDHARLRHRENSFTRTYQLHTADVLNTLRPRLPDDGYALIGLTLTDLYPGDEWNFVFGVAELKNRIGVYSFNRFDPAADRFNRTDLRQRELTILTRSCRVLAHELGHMFGIRHCTFYACVMNGSNHLDESDAQPLHLCPIDLRKLHRSVGFDPRSHHQNLAGVLSDLGISADAEWYERRLRECDRE
jgi:archaemetzincin